MVFPAAASLYLELEDKEDHCEPNKLSLGRLKGVLFPD
jgi:hypothetical protein